MAAVFLVMLYEYSPLFYITVIAVCFIVTTGLVLGWFGLDVPVILRNCEERESTTKISEKRMRKVKNPFGLGISDPTTASLKGGISLKLDCLENCTLTCYWGCSVQKLQEALQKHVYCFRIRVPQNLEEALDSEYLYRAQHNVELNSKEDKLCQIPEDEEIEDFGTVPRTRYPLVALLTLANEDDREVYDIISMVSVIHIPDKRYKLPCRILHQYLLTEQCQFFDLQQLFMSADANPTLPSSTSVSKESNMDSDVGGNLERTENGSETSEEAGKDCVVCQNGRVNWVLLPCRHACLCNGCIQYFQQCPMCRQFVQESFSLYSPAEATTAINSEGRHTEDNTAHY
ncbi:cell growth regulator with RING finger domain protein 1 isoform X1 [Pleurodeles waltl]|uniref:cell growth regulator with RING finger domain protein 1 isoform X1 n=2 Tax=Pleurodeles waltl TaxID=8319 RepID=UPI0037099746